MCQVNDDLDFRLSMMKPLDIIDLHDYRSHPGKVSDQGQRSIMREISHIMAYSKNAYPKVTNSNAERYDFIH